MSDGRLIVTFDPPAPTEDEERFWRALRGTLSTPVAQKRLIDLGLVRDIRTVLYARRRLHPLLRRWPALRRRRLVRPVQIIERLY